MEAKELRIGNLCESDGSILTITAKHILQLETNSKEWCTRPIRLTEEWLVKFGFTKYDEYRFIINSRSKTKYFCLWKFDKENFARFSDWHGHTSIKLKYVHQLQNLYFALTGEELEIK